MFQQRIEDLQGNQDARALISVDIGSSLLFEKGAEFLQFGAAGGGVVEEVGQLRAIGLNVGGGILREARVAFQHQQLVFRAQLLARAVEMAGEMCVGHSGKRVLDFSECRAGGAAVHAEVVDLGGGRSDDAVTWLSLTGSLAWYIDVTALYEI